MIPMNLQFITNFVKQCILIHLHNYSNNSTFMNLARSLMFTCSFSYVHLFSTGKCQPSSDTSSCHVFHNDNPCLECDIIHSICLGNLLFHHNYVAVYLTQSCLNIISHVKYAFKQNWIISYPVPHYLVFLLMYIYDCSTFRWLILWAGKFGSPGYVNKIGCHFLNASIQTWMLSSFPQLS